MKQKGQVTVELILLAIVLLSVTKVILSGLQRSKALSDFASLPQAILKNMISNGNWKKNSEVSRKHHPNQFDRHFNYRETGS